MVIKFFLGMDILVYIFLFFLLGIGVSCLLGIKIFVRFYNIKSLCIDLKVIGV